MSANSTEHFVSIGAREVPIELRLNKRARRIILKVDGLKNVVQLTYPRESCRKEALSFVEERRAWISDRLADSPKPIPFAADAEIPFYGEPARISYIAGSRRAVSYDAETHIISVGGRPEHLNNRILRWLKDQAREKLTAYVDEFCEELKLTRRKVSVRDTKSRWGSCSSSGALSFSWRLILAPRFVLRYVAAHEVAHLRHLDHSPAFWAVVDELVPDRKQAEKWLKNHGQSLYGFGVNPPASPQSEPKSA